MAASLVVKHLYDGAISASDGTGAPVTLSIPFTMGDLSRTSPAGFSLPYVRPPARTLAVASPSRSRTTPTPSIRLRSITS